eukprot:GILK01001533.1.p1 GENE.GILK01001533.1~~GILK01001533.1.p1  ORF type:complete len:352 (+),score=57.81 GILK01001533.1:69-1058(+)
MAALAAPRNNDRAFAKSLMADVLDTNSDSYEKDLTAFRFKAPGDSLEDAEALRLKLQNEREETDRLRMQASMTDALNGTAEDGLLRRLIDVRQKIRVAQIRRPCGSYKTCGDCVMDARGSCGWCNAPADGSAPQCVDGDTKGPGASSYMNCSTNNWNYDFCVGQPCNTYKDCRSCLNDAFCGWCSGGGIPGRRSYCTGGTPEGPIFDGDESCQGGWHHSKSIDAEAVTCPPAEVLPSGRSIIQVLQAVEYTIKSSLNQNFTLQLANRQDQLYSQNQQNAAYNSEGMPVQQPVMTAPKASVGQLVQQATGFGAGAVLNNNQQGMNQQVNQ